MRGTTTPFSDFRLIAVDRPGDGDSDRPTDAFSYREDLIVSDALAVVADVRVERTAVWGLSVGAENATSLAVLGASAVSALICGSNADIRT